MQQERMPQEATQQALPQSCRPLPQCPGQQHLPPWMLPVCLPGEKEKRRGGSKEGNVDMLLRAQAATQMEARQYSCNRGQQASALTKSLGPTMVLIVTRG